MNTELDADDAASQLVSTFLVGDELLGVQTTHVQEIVRYRGVTPVHNAPSFILGVVNLRGKIVTVFDLATRTGLGTLRAASDARIIILDWNDEHVGLLVDEVIDVFPVDPSQIAAPPANLDPDHAAFISGVLQHDAHLIPILDVDAVLAEEEGNVDVGTLVVRGGQR